MDQCFDNIPACREKTRMRPSEDVPRIYADAVVFAPEVLDLCLKVFGADNVMYGSDYPHTIGDHAGMPAPRRRAAGCRTGQGARADGAANFRFLR